MPQISTSLRATRESARLIRYEPIAPFTATNVQDAIPQASTPRTVPTYTAIAAGSPPYTPSNSDNILRVDTSGGPITINLQAQVARGGLDLTVKDVTGNAATNPITLVPAGGETIDGMAPYVIDGNYGGVKLLPQTGGYLISP